MRGTVQQMTIRDLTRPYRWFFYHGYCRQRELGCEHFTGLIGASVMVMMLYVIIIISIFFASFMFFNAGQWITKESVVTCAAIIALNMAYYGRKAVFSRLVEEFGPWDEVGRRPFRIILGLYAGAIALFGVIAFVGLRLQN